MPKLIDSLEIRSRLSKGYHAGAASNKTRLFAALVEAKEDVADLLRENANLHTTVEQLSKALAEAERGRR
jgi:cell fate (sporulation/competence/biofilm development) regulator YlbF (YheA/YmcA/DUF963 family)